MLFKYIGTLFSLPVIYVQVSLYKHLLYNYYDINSNFIKEKNLEMLLHRISHYYLNYRQSSYIFFTVSLIELVYVLIYN